MQILNANIHSDFQGNKFKKNTIDNNSKDVSFQGLISVKKGYRMPLMDPGIKLLGLITAFTSAAGFGLGGAGLNYDHYYKKLHHIKDEQPSKHKKNRSIVTLEDFKASLDKTKPQKKPEFTGKDEDNKEKETGYIEPVTEFGKLGLKAAKIGIFFSGVAGVFNGIAMRVPLMSVGEGLNIAASPIVNTPTGFGLFNIALATVFAGRALENNPALKLNSEVLASLTGKDKAKYVMKNMGYCLKEVVTSSKEVFVQFGKLFKSESKESAKTFFRDCIFATKSKTMTISEKLLADGSTAIETGMKSYPYRMHLASMILATGGAMLLVTGLLKKIGVLKDKNLDKVTKASFKVAEAGGCLDNIGLSYSGLEKMSQGKAASGLALAVSGLGILSGTPNAEKDDGRGRQWLGTSFLFIAFAIERFIELMKTIKDSDKFKAGEVVDESAQLIREWEVHLPNVFGKEFLKNKDNYKLITALSDPSKYNSLIQDFSNRFSTVQLGNLIKGLDSKTYKELVGGVSDPVQFTKAIEKLSQGDKYKLILHLMENVNNSSVNNYSRFIKTVRKTLVEHNGGLFDTEAANVLNKLKEALEAANFGEEFTKELKFLSQGNLGEIAKSVIAENVRISGDNYIKKLQDIVENRGLEDAIGKEAEAVLKKLVKTVA